MPRFLADENFNNDTIRSLPGRNSDMVKPSSPPPYPLNLASINVIPGNAVPGKSRGLPAFDSALRNGRIYPAFPLRA